MKSSDSVNKPFQVYLSLEITWFENDLIVVKYKQNLIVLTILFLWQTHILTVQLKFKFNDLHDYWT